MIYLYLMKGKDRRLRWKTKIGFTNDLDRRRRDISRRMGVEILIVTARKMFLSRYYERALHWLFAPLRSPAWSDGGTEWFVCVRFVAFILIWTIWLLELVFILAIFGLATFGIFAICVN